MFVGTSYKKNILTLLGCICSMRVSFINCHVKIHAYVCMHYYYIYVFISRAQQYYNNNLFAMFAGKLSGLIAVLAVPSILQILVHTKASSIPLTAYRRYLQTIFHTMSWYEEDLKVGSRYVFIFFFNIVSEICLYMFIKEHFICNSMFQLIKTAHIHHIFSADERFFPVRYENWIATRSQFITNRLV